MAYQTHKTKYCRAFHLSKCQQGRPETSKWDQGSGIRMGPHIGAPQSHTKTPNLGPSVLN